MKNSLGLVPILNIVGLAHALLLVGVLVCLRRGNRRANLLLAGLMVIICLLLAGGILTNTRLVLSAPHLAQIHIPFQFLAGPLFFFYVKTLVSGKEVFRKRSFLHLVPFGLCVLYLAPFYFSSADYKVVYLTRALENFPPDWYARTALSFLSELLYLTACFLLLRKYQRRGGERQGPIYQGDLILVRSLMVTFALVWLVGVARLLFAYRVETNLFVPLLLSAATYWICFLGLVRPQSLVGADPAATSSRRYERSTLTAQRAEKYLRRLYECMEMEKPYRDSDLTLQKLAQRLSITPQHLSQTINEQLQQNFADFINSYRVEEAKRGLADPRKRHYSIIAIAEQSGFNSKSAFNTAFKKYANLTPSQFRRHYTSSKAESEGA